MKFVVRYHSSLLPGVGREAAVPGHSPGHPPGHPSADSPAEWPAYSVHPASKLGLHNAMLVVHDRLEILAMHGGDYDCAVFVEDAGRCERLSQDEANRLFAALPRGEVKWLDIAAFRLPAPAAAAAETLPGQPVPRQLALFPHQHTPYDDLLETPHSFDIDV